MFTGPFQAQIDSLVARVATLETNKTLIDSLDSIPAQTGLVAILNKKSGLAGSETFQSVQKGVSDQCVGTPFTPPTDDLKKSGSVFTVAFFLAGKANASVAADNFGFQADYVVFSKNDRNVAAYSSDSVASITRR